MTDRKTATRQRKTRRDAPPPLPRAPLSVVDAKDSAALFHRLAVASALRITEAGRVFLAEDAMAPTHKLRVALRRHRSLLKLFAAHLSPGFLAAQSEQAKAIAARLAPIRETDVMVTETLPALAGRWETANELSPAAATRRQRALAALSRKLEKNAERARTALRRDPEFSLALCDLLLDLNAELAAPSGRTDAPCAAARPAKRPAKPRRLARAALDAAARKLARFGNRLDTLTIDKRHEMRKKAKTLRYAVEFFGPLFDPLDAKPYRKALRRLQDSFGVLNDAADLEKLRSVQLSTTLRPFVEAAIEEVREHASREYALAKTTWADFDKRRPFWRK
ncbi:MAG: CHAD domain-containing protein [Pseudomonadota bacterium]